jgi:uncharacterized membrane protein
MLCTCVIVVVVVVVVVVVIVVMIGKVKFTLEQATKAQRGSRFIALLFF